MSNAKDKSNVSLCVVFRRITVALSVCLLLSGCEGNNPAVIQAERSGAPATPTQPPVEVSRPERAEEPAPIGGAFTMKEAGLVANNPQLEVKGLVKPDIQVMINSGDVSVNSNCVQFRESVMRLFDGDPQSLDKSNAVNPVFLELKFKKAIKLKTIRALFTHASGYDWAVHTDPNKPGVKIVGAGDWEWSRIDLAKPEETQWVRIEMLRTVGDNYVHINEIELYVE